MTQPSSIDSKTPFVSRAREYVEKGWGVVPLPEKRKEYPPTGFTGRAGKFADEDDLINWLSDPKFKQGNIAIRVGNMLVVEGVRYEVIGIDVDNYKDKKGAKELAALENKYGKLPDTWIVTSRSDGISGIRFYLVPYGYGFRGKASDSIEIIQRVHRYAVTFPSVHPDTGGQYWWYAPGSKPNGVDIAPEIPDATKLPVLLDNWIQYLTDDYRDDNEGQYGIDLDSSVDQIKQWIATKFNQGEQCPRMKSLVAQHISTIEETTSHHDKIMNAHWNLINEAAEGHTGVLEAIEEVEAVYIKVVAATGKRPETSVRKEAERSRWGTFRKVKAKAEAMESQGLQFFSPELCMNEGELGLNADSGDGLSWIYDIPMKEREYDPKDYDKNDVGQANQLVDRVGDNIRWVEDYKAWIVYDGKTWHIDTSKLMQDLFHRACVEPSKRRAASLLKAAKRHIDNGGLPTDAQYKQMTSNIKKLIWIAEHYGNLPKIKSALERAQSIPGVSVKYDQLNWDTTILAMPNGKVLKLDEPAGKGKPNALGYTVIDNEKEFFTTQSTAVEFVEPKKLNKNEIALWTGYLNLFLPDIEYRNFVQKALGYILIGGNPEKLAIFLVGRRNTGKSTMLQAIQAALGDYGATFQPNAVFKDSGTGNNPELGNLLHKRGIFSSESGSQRIHANPLKRNTGGDKISVTRKYANDQIIGIPHFVSVVATNQAPTIDDADEALIKRIMVLPFDIQVDDEHNDRRADVVIPREAKRAVLSWLVMGYRRYIREGLGYEGWHDTVKAATLEFASELSDVASYVSEVCDVAPNEIKMMFGKMPGTVESENLRNEWSQVTFSLLYNGYLSTVGDRQKPLSDIAFRKKIKQMFNIDTFQGRAGTKTSCKRWFGLKWKNEESMNQIVSR